MNEKACREIARHHGVTILTGSSLVSEACAIAKARQKNVMKTRQGAEASRVHQRVFIDIKSFRAPKVKHLLDKVGAYFVTQTGVFK